MGQLHMPLCYMVVVVVYTVIMICSGELLFLLFFFKTQQQNGRTGKIVETWLVRYISYLFCFRLLSLELAQRLLAAGVHTQHNTLCVPRRR